MASRSENLHPTFSALLGREEKECRLRQRAKVVWFYGLSGSGKTTLANALERRLHAGGFTTHLLDGDNVRTGLNRDLGFTDADRTENIRRIAEVSKLFVQAGVITLNAFITPRQALRDLARQIIGADDLIEIYVEASYATCAGRDPKGLYAKAQGGQVPRFTGRDSAFEPPTRADLVLNTETAEVDTLLDKVHALVVARLRPA